MADRRSIGRMTTIQLQRTAPTVYNNFPRSVLWMGTVQTICGVTILVAGFVGLALCSVTGTALVTMGSVQTAVWVILAGSFGIAAGRMKTTCEITTSTVFSILASILSVSLVVMSGKALINGISASHGSSADSQYRPTYGSSHSDPAVSKYDVPLCAFLLVVSIVEAFTSITMSSVGCQFSCFCCRNCCCLFDMTTTEKGMVFEGQAEHLLQPVIYAAPTAPTAYVVTSQQQTMYQPTLPADTAAAAGNNAWLQNQYTKLDDDMLSA